jgi:acyl-CoA synthetase (AMP-forming)/AMP-acid ligase II
VTFIAQNLSARDAETHILTDGQDTCIYAELRDVFPSMRARFHECGLERDVCLAFECENSLLSALILLFLLEEGHDFLLVPKRKQGCKAGPAEVPQFCAYLVAANRDQFTEVTDSAYLDLAPNAAYREGDCRAAGSRLYVRTSGSTGTPKLAVHTHRGLRQNALNCIERFHLQSSDRVAIPVPLSHMYGLGAFVATVAVGASIDLQKGANVIGYISRERDFQPTCAYLTPAFCETLLKGRKISRAYRLTVTSGDRLRGDTFSSYEARFGPLVQQYGSTELGAIAAGSPDDPAEARAQTVGTPFADVEVCIRESPAAQNGSAGKPCETNDIGELWCRHAYGFHGYADESGVLRHDSQPPADGWHRMHDLGRIGSDGRIQVAGRSDHAVNRSGLLVLFADIEASIRTIPGVDTAVVVASGESDYGTGLAAFCVPVSGAAVAASDIYAACLERMPRREIPDLIVVAADLPLLPSGKVDRLALIKMANIHTSARSAEREPSSLGGEPC